VLVNAAGISHASSLGTTSWETIQQIINPNLNATIAMSKIFQRIAVQWTRLPIRKCRQGLRQVQREPVLVEEPTSTNCAVTEFGPSRSCDADRGPWPCIINISSLLGVKGGSAATAYAASKAGVLGFTRALVCEHEKTVTNIRVNAIVPGYIDTPMTKGEYLLMSSCHRVSSYECGSVSLPISIPSSSPVSGSSVKHSVLRAPYCPPPVSLPHCTTHVARLFSLILFKKKPP
jgi:NAD(P)-dependent dehydrogenase (short-subunit alcohol dehydrogenase family)